MRALVAELEERLRWSVQSGKEKGRWRFYFFNGGWGHGGQRGYVY